MSKSCQKVVKKLSKKMLKSCQKVAKQLSKSCQKVFTKSCQKVENLKISCPKIKIGNLLRTIIVEEWYRLIMMNARHP
jgi:hypothetical protein